MQPPTRDGSGSLGLLEASMGSSLGARVPLKSSYRVPVQVLQGSFKEFYKVTMKALGGYIAATWGFKGFTGFP